MKCYSCGKVDPAVEALHATDSVCDDCVLKRMVGMTKTEVQRLQEKLESTVRVCEMRRQDAERLLKLAIDIWRMEMCIDGPSYDEVRDRLKAEGVELEKL